MRDGFLFFRLWCERWISEFSALVFRCPQASRLARAGNGPKSDAGLVEVARTEQDLKRALEIFDSSFSDSRSRSRLRLYFNRFRTFFFLIRVGGDAAGFCVYRPVQIGPVSMRRVVLYSVAVDPEFRGLGLGSTLMARSFEELLSGGFSEVALLVEPGNPAVALYEAFGFREEARFQHRDLILMRCRIDQRENPLPG